MAELFNKWLSLNSSTQIDQVFQISTCLSKFSNKILKRFQTISHRRPFLEIHKMHWVQKTYEYLYPWLKFMSTFDKTYVIWKKDRIPRLYGYNFWNIDIGSPAAFLMRWNYRLCFNPQIYRRGRKYQYSYLSTVNHVKLGRQKSIK